MKPILLRLLKRVAWLFNFKKPCIRHLDFIDLILDDKALLLISWEISHANRIHIYPGKITGRCKTGAGIYKLPGSTGKVEIVLRNTWRKTKTSLCLNPAKIDAQTLRYMEQHLSAGHVFSVHLTPPELAMPAVYIEKKQLQLFTQPKISSFNCSINQLQFNDYVP